MRKSGYKKVVVTSDTINYGADILASKNGRSYAIQCKRSDERIGIEALKEIYAGRKIYKADQAIVLTNNYYTEEVQWTADRVNIFLWDRDRLIQMLQ